MSKFLLAPLLLIFLLSGTSFHCQGSLPAAPDCLLPSFQHGQKKSSTSLKKTKKDKEQKKKKKKTRGLSSSLIGPSNNTSILIPLHPAENTRSTCSLLPRSSFDGNGKRGPPSL